MKYQLDYARHFPAVTDRTIRDRKAIKIIRVLEDFLKRDLSGLTVLDMGCSIGATSERLAASARLTIGIDIDRASIQQATQERIWAHFAIADVGAVPCASAMFDVIVCSQVYEHAPSLELLVAEIYRLLKDDGVCFFSGPNRWTIMEEHYKLPFLSWLPRRWANQYVRLAQRGQEYYEHPRSNAELRRALRKFFIRDYTARLLSNPEYFALGKDMGTIQHILVRAPFVRQLLRPWVPNFNWILTKNVQAPN